MLISFGTAFVNLGRYIPMEKYLNCILHNNYSFLTDICFHLKKYCYRHILRADNKTFIPVNTKCKACHLFIYILKHIDTGWKL